MTISDESDIRARIASLEQSHRRMRHLAWGTLFLVPIGLGAFVSAPDPVVRAEQVELITAKPVEGVPSGPVARPAGQTTSFRVRVEVMPLGGVPYESTIQMKGGGEGVMSLMAKMFNISSTSTVTSVETGALAATMFAPPADYKLKTQK